MFSINPTLPKQEEIEFGWWVKIITLLPECTYYFGSFASIQEAASALTDYREDSKQEGAKGMMVWIEQCKPEKLTSFKD